MKVKITPILFHTFNHSLLGYLLIGTVPELREALFFTFGYILIFGVGISINAHRILSHGAFSVSPEVQKMLSVLTCLAGQGSPLLWVTVHHQIHHRHTDRKEDLHSPVNGFIQSYFGWLFKIDKILLRGKGDSFDIDPFQLFLHQYYFSIYYFLVALGLLIDRNWGTYGILLPSVVSFHVVSLVNFFCHLRGLGYRNFRTRDNSTNLLALGLLTFGESYHNNHHHNPKSGNFGVQKYEIDLGYLLARSFTKVTKSGSSSNFK